MIPFFVGALIIVYLAISGTAAIYLMGQQSQWEHLTRLRRQDQMRQAQRKEDAA